jgi:hypothetical protein
MNSFIILEHNIEQICYHAHETVLQMLHQTEHDADNPVLNDVMQLYAQLNDVCSIRGGYTILNVCNIDINNGIIFCNDNKQLNVGNKVCAYLRHAELIAVFIATAGENFTLLANKYNREGDCIKGYIIDTFGSVIAERVADHINYTLEQSMLQQQLKITNRYSPGYCNWPLSGQKELFAVVSPEQCGITLTDSMLMQPIKSVSGVIGIGHNVKKKPYGCDVCNDKKCIYRNILINNQLYYSTK